MKYEITEGGVSFFKVNRRMQALKKFHKGKIKILKKG
jgi:hypothetical protein